MSSANWVDLLTHSDAEVVQTDVCIIGAGAAGLYLAAELSRHHVDTVVIEAGALTASTGYDIGFDPVFGYNPYPGATVGRFFGMGGSTSRWGGVLVPHTTHDLRDVVEHKTTWRTIVERVQGYSLAVLERLGYDRDPDFTGYAVAQLPAASAVLAQVGLDLHTNLMLPFRRKNLLTLWEGLARSAMPRVYFNAVAKDWQFQPAENDLLKLGGVMAVSRNGKKLTVKARRFVIAAGAIESTRILLEIHQAAGERLCHPNAAPGCYLADHLSLPIANVLPEDNATACAVFAPRFQNAWMRNFRFLVKAPSATVPRSFAHFIFEQDSKAFKVAKEVLGALQGRHRPSVSGKDVMQGLGGLSLLAFNRFVHSRLYVPKGTPFRLQLDIEQEPVEKNKVCLAREVDEYGRRRARIDWSVSDQDCTVMAETAAQFLALWPKGNDGVPRLIPRIISNETTKPYDAYHPVGTCRMGDRENAVVDLKLRVNGSKNLWIVSTGVLPSAGTANPTFTMLCLAHELAMQFRQGL